MIKVMSLRREVQSKTHNEFLNYHRTHHAPLFNSIPETKQFVRKVSVSHTIRSPEYLNPPYDGIVELWFDRWEDQDLFYSSKNYLEKVHPDEANSTISLALTRWRLMKWRLTDNHEAIHSFLSRASSRNEGSVARLETYVNNFPNAVVTREPNGVPGIKLNTGDDSLVMNGYVHEQHIISLP